MYSMQIQIFSGLMVRTLSITFSQVQFPIKSKKGGKDFYTILNQNLEKPTSQHKWNNIYNIEEETWKAIYSFPFKLSLGTKMQWFQTRINHRILPTKNTCII